MEWDREMCLQLIELYKSKSEIQQPTHNLYYHKIKKEDAWNELSKDVNTTVDAIKSKINSLLALFRKEKTKKEQSIGTGKGMFFLGQGQVRLSNY